MKTKILLRVAAILLLHTAGHTLGALTWKEAPNARVATVINGMQNEHFGFMGHSVSLGAFFDGYGLTMIGVLLLLALMLWLEPNSKSILLIGLFLLFMGIIELIYFFPFAAIISLLAGMCTLLAYISWKPSH